MATLNGQIVVISLIISASIQLVASLGVLPMGFQPMSPNFSGVADLVDNPGDGFSSNYEAVNQWNINAYVGAIGSWAVNAATFQWVGILFPGLQVFGWFGTAICASLLGIDAMKMVLKWEA